jgi:hypothetical protein
MDRTLAGKWGRPDQTERGFGTVGWELLLAACLRIPPSFRGAFPVRHCNGAISRTDLHYTSRRRCTFQIELA